MDGERARGSVRNERGLSIRWIHGLASSKPRWGRPGTPAEVALRMLILKPLYDWSFDECEREVRASLVYRSFCRVYCERVPDAKTLVRIAKLVDEQTLREMLKRSDCACWVDRDHVAFVPCTDFPLVTLRFPVRYRAPLW